MGRDARRRGRGSAHPLPDGEGGRVRRGGDTSAPACARERRGMSPPGTSDLFRALNTCISELPVPSTGTVDLICECLDMNCTQAIRMTLAECAGLLEDDSIRAVVHGHDAGFGDVVERSDRYALVRPGRAAAGEPTVAAAGAPVLRSEGVLWPAS